MKKYIITAAGILVDRVFIKNGQRVKKGDALFSVEKTATVSIWASASESGGADESEKVSGISPLAQTNQKGRSTVECLAEINSPDDRLKAGYTTKTEIILSRKNNAFTVPYSALEKDNEGEYV